MSRAKQLLSVLEAEGLLLGCYDPAIDKISDSEFSKVLDNISYQNDTKIIVKGKPFIVQIDRVENEIDFDVRSLSWYEERFGKWED